jgi:hypothetical protein
MWLVVSTSLRIKHAYMGGTHNERRLKEATFAWYEFFSCHLLTLAQTVLSIHSFEILGLSPI